MATMGYLAARRSRRVAHHSLLVTCLFPNEGSKLELFATPELLELARSHSRINGVMDGDALASSLPGCARPSWSGATGSTITCSA